MPEPTPSKDSQKAIKYAQEAVENWKDLSPDDFETHVLSGGITNSLICVSKNSEKVIVRLYGKDSEAVVDRERESTVNAAVADCGFNKPTLLEFDGGRVEGWVEGSVINAEDMIQPEMQKRRLRRGQPLLRDVRLRVRLEFVSGRKSAISVLPVVSRPAERGSGVGGQPRRFGQPPDRSQDFRSV
eukprot:181326_1